ncbi:lipopolysaccharide-induced tumor necrosis factor-alpha factor homolog [Ostrea edulis]|uniref:lipopolysaccharide-induced tumor necrosis factor-alpha factor homolog n=1 Tax=Ostrea edulis TaxID=37623 RepID=UPI002095F583|nr:lipopolysaccharide-induced tumor necrosis factor-alpha factor homolog [Ostrea edulis]XP_055996980.1 lipopolysaccharide-induced tumor necrosis factor-alpha factor homolog [Ostrea edulis]
MENKDTTAHNPPPAYQTFPQQGQQVPPSVYPREAPPKYEEGLTSYQQNPGSYQHGTTVVTTQPVVYLQDQSFNTMSKPMICPCCNTQISTSVEYEAGALTWLSSGLICIFGCWLGCCLIPFCIQDLQDVKHICPNCSKVVGVYRRI